MCLVGLIGLRDFYQRTIWGRRNTRNFIRIEQAPAASIRSSNISLILSNLSRILGVVAVVFCWEIMVSEVYQIDLFSVGIDACDSSEFSIQPEIVAVRRTARLEF